MKVMKKRMILMIWRMSSIFQAMIGEILTTLPRQFWLLALISDGDPTSMVQGLAHQQNLTLPPLLPRSLC